MVRFKKGSKVEVWDQREVPSGCWRSAQIIYGNGHSYYVKYDGFSSVKGESAERVPRKALRPCPPLAEPQRSWMVGDVLEVYENGSWKIALISSFADGGYLFVRLLDSFRRYRTHESDIRLRQSWKDDKWVIVVQGCGNCKEEKMTVPALESSWFFKMSQQCAWLNQRVGRRDNCVEDPSRGLLKRRRGTCLLPQERWHEGGRRNKAARQEQYDAEFTVLPSQLIEKVDAVVSPYNTVGEKYMHASFNNRSGFSELDTRKADDENLTLNHDHADNISSSVGSCSISGSLYRSMYNPITDGSENISIYSDDAQSCSGSKEEPSLARREASEQDIHELELQAYCTTMAALYASGPISWEQEALLTNLRLMLHISNDEHLAEIRHLVSLDKKTPLR